MRIEIESQPIWDDAARVTDDGTMLGCFGSSISTNHHSSIAADVCVVARDGNGLCSTKNSVRIESYFAFKEIVGWVAIQQSRGADQNESFVLVGHVDVGIERMDRGFMILGSMRSRRVGRDGRWCRNGRGEFVRTYNRWPKRRNGSGNNAFGKGFVVDEGDVEDSQPTFAASGIEKLAAMLQRKYLWLSIASAEGFKNIATWMLMGMFKFTMVF